jgi:alpha-1,2-mannosyltransferase
MKVSQDGWGGGMVDDGHWLTESCEIVFNYWEPAHYLAHGSGFQTWEYSPEYAIRSWLYVGLHSILGRLFALVPGTPKTFEFYGMRLLFAIFCSYCETRLYTTISRNLSRQIGLIYVFGSILSAGMFHATATFLPSTFAMYTTMLGMADFIDRKGGLKTARVVFWFALGGLLGWPFALVLIVPLMLEELILVIIRRSVYGFISRLLKGGFAALALLATIIAVDSIAYRKLEVVPLNIVLYNVFSAPGRGPTIYGTEPWWFYFANLALNFNVLLPLALISAILVVSSSHVLF